MQLKKLTLPEIQEIYETRAQTDFPKNEIKPFRIIRGLFLDRLYFAYGLYDGEMLLAYAFFVIPKIEGCTMLDYYAVTPESRGKGIGGTFLKMLSKELAEYPAIIIEVESRRSAKNENEIETRERRISFYLKNGFYETKLFSKVFGVDYEIMYLPAEHTISDELLIAQLNYIYDVLFGKNLVRKLFAKVTPKHAGE